MAQVLKEISGFEQMTFKTSLVE